MLRTGYAKVGERGQITIPKEMRQDLNIKSGELVKLEEVGGEISIHKMSKTLKGQEDPLLAALKKLKGKITMKDWEDIRKERQLDG